MPHWKENNERVRCLSDAEEIRLRDVLRRSYPGHEDEFEFALQTGLRQGNQFQLTWSMVDLFSGTLRIPHAKNGKTLDLPLNNAAETILRQLSPTRHVSGRVFISRETGKALNYPKHWFTKAVRQAGITNFHWHDIRHTFATRLRRHGVALEDIPDLLGHECLAMTKRYAHNDLERLHKAVGLLNRPGGIGTDTRCIGINNRGLVRGVSAL